MIRNLIATSAAMLFVMGGATFPEEAHGSPVDTSTDPSIVRATVRAPIAVTPRIACIYALFRAADTHPAAVEAPATATSAPGGRLPRSAPGNRRWICRAVADDDTPLPPPDPPMIRSPEALPAASSMDTLPHVSLGTVDFNPPELPNVDHETLPAPTPIQTAPAAVAPMRAVADAIFAVPPILRTPGMVSLDVEAMAWLSPNLRTPTGISALGPVGTSFAAGAGDTLGDEHLSNNVMAGARVTLGYWWTEDDPWVPGGKLPTCGIETRFMSVAQRSVGFVDDQSPTLVRPFYDLATGMTSGVVVATPGLATGALSGTASESLWGLEANVWQTLRRDWPGTTFSVEGMLGLRYLDLSDGIQIDQVSSFVANPVGFPAYASLAGNRIVEQDSFSTQNRFIGGQAGVRGNLYFDTFVFTGEFRMAVGDTIEQVNVQGSQVRTLANGQTIVSQGAVLALPGNIGRYTDNKLAIVPEMGLKVAVPINEHLTLGVGFTTLYWSRIARPGDQVDLTTNSNQIPSFPGATGAAGVSRTGIPFNQADMWLLGANFSIQVKW